MTDLLTVADLNAELIRLSKQLDADHSNLIRLSSLWANEENAYRMAQARAFMAAVGTVPLRKAQVDLQTEDERIRAHQSDALLRAARLKMQATMAQLSALQTIGGAIKAEMAMSGRV